MQTSPNTWPHGVSRGCWMTPKHTAQMRSRFSRSRVEEKREESKQVEGAGVRSMNGESNYRK